MRVQNISALRNSNFNNSYRLNRADNLAPQSTGASYSASGAQALAMQNIAFGNMQSRKDYREETIKAIKEVIKPALEEDDTAGILNALGYEAYADEDGYVTLNNDFESSMAYNNVSFEELGIDVQKLLNKIKEINGDCTLDEDSIIESTGALNRVDGNLYAYAPIYNIPNLEFVGKDAFLGYTISGYDIEKELTIEGKAVFYNSSRDWDTDDKEEFKNVNAKDILIMN